MRAYIKKLQSKSEVVRKQVLVGSLIVCMSFVGLIWIGSLGYKFSKGNTARTQESGNISSSVKKEESKTAEKQIDLIPVEY